MDTNTFSKLTSIVWSVICVSENPVVPGRGQTTSCLYMINAQPRVHQIYQIFLLNPPPPTNILVLYRKTLHNLC